MGRRDERRKDGEGRGEGGQRRGVNGEEEVKGRVKG